MKALPIECCWLCSEHHKTYHACHHPDGPKHPWNGVDRPLEGVLEDCPLKDYVEVTD